MRVARMMDAPAGRAVRASSCRRPRAHGGGQIAVGAGAQLEPGPAKARGADPVGADGHMAERLISWPEPAGEAAGRR